jgi:ABC-type multidrug transport system permease subunit
MSEFMRIEYAVLLPAAFLLSACGSARVGATPAASTVAPTSIITSLQWASRLIPLTYFLVIVRSIVLKGTGLSLLLPEVGALALFATLVVAIAVSRFQKRLD